LEFVEPNDEMRTAPVSHLKRPQQSATNAIKSKRKQSEINEADRFTAAHNGLVAGSSPAGPTNESTAYQVFILPTVRPPHQKRSVSLLTASVQGQQTNDPWSIGPWLLPFNRRYGGFVARNG
jgi:hypothetical protein